MFLSVPDRFSGAFLVGFVLLTIVCCGYKLYTGAVGYLVGLDYMATVIRQEIVRFPAEAQGILSLFCLGPQAEGITLTGLKYPLEKGTLTPGFPLGVSNHFTGIPATITVEKGSILALWDRKNGFPKRK